MILIPELPGKPRKNDAIFLYGALQPKPWVHVYEQNAIEVVHGPSCVAAKEINAVTCNEDGVCIIERRGGGGTVVLAPGVIVTVVVGERRAQETIREIFSRIHRAMMQLLDGSSARIHETGISDLAIAGRKILGSSLYLAQKPFYFYYQSSLLVNPDLSLMEKYLKHPPKEPDYRGKRSHADFCTSLTQEGYNLTCSEIIKKFDSKLAALLKAE
jgi:lipoate-protein ligase A